MKLYNSERNYEFKRNRIVAILLLSILTASELFVGQLLSSGRHIWQIDGKDFWIILFYLAIMIILHVLIFNGFDYCTRVKVKRSEKFDKRFFVFSFIVIFLCYIPVFLAYYPCVWAYDPFDELVILHGWWGKHSYGHMIFMDVCIKVGYALNNVYFGLVFYSIVQMLFMALCFAFAASFINKTSRYLAIIAVIFYAIMPFNSIMAISSVKDTMYTGFITVLVVCLMDYIGGNNRKSTIAIYIACVFGTITFRKNGIHVIFLWTLLIIIVTIISSVLKRNKTSLIGNVIKINSICIIAYLIFHSVFVQLVHGTPGPEAEAFAVPLQCMMETAARHEELVPEYGKHEKLFNLIDRDIYENDLETYINPHNADAAKSYFAYYYPQEEYDFNQLEATKQFFCIGLKYPIDYADIFLTLSKGAWYPLDEDYAKIYGYGRENRQGYLLTDFKTGWAGINERPASKFPALEYFYEGIVSDNNFFMNRLLQVLMAPATYWWIIRMLFMYYLCRITSPSRKEWDIAFLLVFSIFCGVLLSPVVIVRYMYPIMVLTPIMISVVVEDLKHE